MKQTRTPKLLPISSIVIDRSFNVRDEEAYQVQALKDDLALRGQQEAGIFELLPSNGDEQPKYRPVRGFRRATAIAELAEAYAIDPLTGKPFTSILAFVVEDLTEAERVNLLIDHGQRRNLNAAELQKAFERFFNAGFDEKSIATINRDLIDLNYPPKKNVGNDPDELLKYRRGLIQTAKMAWRAPDCVHETWMGKLRGKHSYPNKAELFKLVGIFTEECKTSNEYNKANPGPKFMEEWNAFLAKQAEAAESGGARGKSTAMMNNQQATDAKAQVNSLTLKTVFDVVLSKIPRDRLTLLDKIVCEHFEKNMSEEVRQMILSAGRNEPVTTETTPVTEAPVVA